jgi:hypothetical protein
MNEGTMDRATGAGAVGVEVTWAITAGSDPKSKLLFGD